MLRLFDLLYLEQLVFPERTAIVILPLPSCRQRISEYDRQGPKVLSHYLESSRRTTAVPPGQIFSLCKGKLIKRVTQNWSKLGRKCHMCLKMFTRTRSVQDPSFPVVSSARRHCSSADTLERRAVPDALGTRVSKQMIA